MGDWSGAMEDMGMTPTKILFLGDVALSEELVPWMLTTSTSNIEIVCCTRGDQPASKVLPALPVRYLGALTREQSSHLVRTMSTHDSFLITCYWPWLLDASDLELLRGRSLNFHPAPLPRDRGWYPHVHQIRNGSPSGVTLHQLEATPDSGAIWAQKRVELAFPMTAGDARQILQAEMVSLFKSTWWSIFQGHITPTPQMGQGNFLSKSGVDEFNSLDRHSSMTVEEVIRRLAARNIGDRSFVQLEGDREALYVHISFSRAGLRTEENLTSFGSGAIDQADEGDGS